MAYDMNFPADDSYLADFPAGDREQNRALKDDQIVNAGKLQGLTAGNKNGQIPINNGTENTNLNAALLNGKASSYFATSNHTHDVATQSSNGYMSNADKKKLDGIASGAEVNQNAFSNIKIGSTTIQADGKQDTLELVAGTNISILGDTNNDKVTISIAGKIANAVQADSATKATQDKNGNEITNTYIKNISSNNDKITIIKGDDTSSSITINNVQTSNQSNIATKAKQDNLGNQIDTTYAKLSSPAFIGTPTAPTPGVDTNNTQIATCGFVRNAIAKYAPMLDTLKKVYPVGSIYMSTVSTNPATLFGFGTWEAMPAGRVLLAQGTASWGTYNAGSTGGEATHQLTVGEMPSHTHSASTNTAGTHYHTVNAIYGAMNGGGPSFNRGPTKLGSINTSSTGNHNHIVTINSTGSSEAHNNMMPYLAVYIWQRIS